MTDETLKWVRLGRMDGWLPDSFMAELSPDAVRRLGRHGRIRRDVESITITGDEAAVIIVLFGAVKVFRMYWGGKQTLVHVAGLGDVLNAEAVLTGEDATHTTFAAKRRAVVLALPRRRFGALVARDEDIGRALTRSFARRVQEHDMWRGHVGRTVEAQVMAFLVGLARRHGYRFPSGTTRLELGLTQLDIASALGVSSSSVEGAMRNLRNAGKIGTGYASVTLYEVPSEEALDQAY